MAKITHTEGGWITFRKWLAKLAYRWLPAPLAAPTPSRVPADLTRALNKARSGAAPVKTYKYPIQAPVLAPGVVPSGRKAAIAMDSVPYAYAGSCYAGSTYSGFPGYPYLAELATRAEYRAMASALSTEITREWIVLNSSETDDDSTKQKITEITAELKRLGVQNVVREAAEHDAYYGRSQMFLDIKGADTALPLLIDKRTIAKGSFTRICTIEPLWTTPSSYDALNPAAPYFYKPSSWWVLGKVVSSTRLLTVITREVPDLLKPAFNFSGISLSQLAEPYVDNWLRTRQSVSDLISAFSTTALQTDMSQVLQSSGDATLDGVNAENLFSRAELFTLTRDNKGLMLLDKERETLVQLNTPLSGLDALQAQAQEQMCSVSRMPSVILTGISPQGLNPSADGEIRVFYDWIAAQQEAFWRTPIETILKVVQLSMYGEIDENITVTFQPLYQMTPKELAEIRKNDADAAGAYIDRGVISAEEQREKLARDPESGYQGLEMMDETE
jgi:uncharacterized protein